MTATDSSYSSSSVDDTNDPYVVDPSESEWDEKTTKAMIKYLGGQVLPYIDMGTLDEPVYKSNVSSDGYRSSLVLTGTKFVETKLEDALSTYEKHDWKAVIFKEKTFIASVNNSTI